VNLTTSQLTALKADIVSDGALNGLPMTSDGATAIVAAYSVIVAPDFFVYRTRIPVQEIYDQIQWAKMTPTDAPDGTAAWTNRSLACQGKQFNLQLLLQGSQQSIDGTKSNVRAGLQDALTNVPSGVSGVTQAANWVGVRDNALARKATRAEKLFASTANGNGATAATAATMVVEGALSVDDVMSARNL
jgi:hypothetical protein